MNDAPAADKLALGDVERTAVGGDVRPEQIHADGITGQLVSGRQVDPLDDAAVGRHVEQAPTLVEDQIATDGLPTQRGLRGTAVIRGRVTDLLDVNELVLASDPSRFTEAAAA